MHTDLFLRESPAGGGDWHNGKRRPPGHALSLPLLLHLLGEGRKGGHKRQQRLGHREDPEGHLGGGVEEHGIGRWDEEVVGLGKAGEGDGGEGAECGGGGEEGGGGGGVGGVRAGVDQAGRGCGGGQGGLQWRAVGGGIGSVGVGVVR